MLLVLSTEFRKSHLDWKAFCTFDSFGIIQNSSSLPSNEKLMSTCVNIASRIAMTADRLITCKLRDTVADSRGYRKLSGAIVN